METYFISFVFVSLVLGFAYAIMRVLSQSAGNDDKKRNIYFVIFFAVCALFYSFWENDQNKYNEEIRDYLYQIEQAHNKIYDELDGTNLLFNIEDELTDIYECIQEIYYIMNS